MTVADEPVPDVVRLCSELIAINTSNPTHPEAPAAEYVVAELQRAGIASCSFESAPGRVSVVARIPGRDGTLPPLLVHAHLDTVPAVADEWSVDPFSGAVQDGFVWGRGAVDMKSMVAAVLAVVARYGAEASRPRRDLVLAFFADEEAGGELGAGWLTAKHPELFDCCEEAIGEIGGFSHSISDACRLYLVSTAEKGVHWARLTASGRAGHGSMINGSNAVSTLAGAVSRVAAHEFGRDPRPPVDRFLAETARALGLPGAPAERVLDRLGALGSLVAATLQDTANPTTFTAGYKSNVIPSLAEATVDCRFLPGNEDGLITLLRHLVGDRIEIETEFRGPAVEAPWDVPLLGAMESALRLSDPIATVVPYMTPGFTDAKWLSRLGIRCYGFCPLLLPDGLDFPALFHGVDERVPVSALEFAVPVLERFFDAY